MGSPLSLTREHYTFAVSPTPDRRFLHESTAEGYRSGVRPSYLLEIANGVDLSGNMTRLWLIFVLVVSGLGQLAGARDVSVTGVAGRSWLNQLNRTFDETSMGKTGHLGPAAPLPGDPASRWQLGLSTSATEAVSLHGADIYRLNCQSCHGESGQGAPPEINSVINPVRATSVAMVMERMKTTGMSMSRAEVSKMAEQSKDALLQRLHNGGQDMPAFPHLDDTEVRALIAYLKQLSGLPGAEREQTSVKESPIRVGEHIVKSTCHICHAAYGANPSPQQLSEGAIPPLSALTGRVTLSEFVRKVTAGAPIMMGTPALASRGRMPVFYYLSQDEAADVYLYLTIYPPYKWAALDPVVPAHRSDRAADIAPVLTSFAGSDLEPPSPPTPSPTPEIGMQIAPSIGVGLFLILLLAGGFTFTVRECMRLSAVAEGRNLVPSFAHGGNATMQAESEEEDQRLIA
jgi:mono/diheme cytochrome c family protein